MVTDLLPCKTIFLSCYDRVYRTLAQEATQRNNTGRTGFGLRTGGVGGGGCVVFSVTEAAQAMQGPVCNQTCVSRRTLVTNRSS
jgi:hypothetical protein